LPPRVRIVLAAVTALVVIIGAVLVAQARSADGDVIPGAAWRGDAVPRSAKVDEFARAGAPGTVDGFGSWNVATGSFVVADGRLHGAGSGPAVATVDAGSADVLVHAQVVAFGGGSGLLLSATPDGRSGLALSAVGSTSWELSWRRGDDGSEVLETFTAPTSGVAVQIDRLDDRVKVAFDTKAFDVDVPPASAAGTSVGVVSAGPGTDVDLFGYLRLDAG
jgi:hypothetical protein